MPGKDVSLGEFVKQLAVLMSGNDLVMLFKEEKPWHTVFYRLKRENTAGKPAFFNTLRFDWDGPYPKSQELSRFIQVLHCAGTVGAVNPSYEQIVLSGEMSDLWSKLLEGLAPEAKGFLDHATAIAKEEFPAEREAVDPRPLVGNQSVLLARTCHYRLSDFPEGYTESTRLGSPTTYIHLHVTAGLSTRWELQRLRPRSLTPCLKGTFQCLKR